jgi:hypothetical protein
MRVLADGPPLLTTQGRSHYCQLVHGAEPKPEYLPNCAFRSPRGLAGRGVNHPLHAVHLALGLMCARWRRFFHLPV